MLKNFRRFILNIFKFKQDYQPSKGWQPPKPLYNLIFLASGLLTLLFWRLT